MKRPAAFPDVENFKRMGKVVHGLVKQDIP
jgi:hypothetical protein